MPRKSARARREELAASDPMMADLVERLGPLDLAKRLRRRREERPADAFNALLRSIVGQQLSTKAARAIHLRMLALFDGPPTPEAMLALTEEDLRGVGFSRRKVEYVHDLAAHVLDGSLELDRLDALDDEQVVAEISAVRGLGRWTAEVFLLLHLGRPDVIVGGDLGIRKAIMVEDGLEAMPTPKEVEARAEPWWPNRSLACLYLWESLHAVPD
ncbi:MAG TPA: DNA-3-methyladenine glycosylase 2 family protein [Solirubrobacterales bacterium]|nr:DNA-3-methyladenine glycosylase 2 family protein [Solirubrobacterales bacterium]